MIISPGFRVSASILHGELGGRAVGVARERAKQALTVLHDLAAGDGDAPLPLGLFVGLRGAPARLPCAQLPWHAVLEALSG